MSLVRFDSDAEVLEPTGYSAGTGPVHRGEAIEVTKISFEKGRGADVHQHPEEQVVYVPHGVTALEDVVALSVKSGSGPMREATGRPD